MTLSNLEKETIILFNEGEGAARIETFDRRLLRQLRNVSTCEGVSCEEDQKDYGVFVIPKTMIKIHAPRTLNLSDEQRAEKSKLMKSLNDNHRKINSTL